MGETQKLVSWSFFHISGFDQGTLLSRGLCGVWMPGEIDLTAGVAVAITPSRPAFNPGPIGTE